MIVPGNDVILAIVLFISSRLLCWDKGIYFSSNVPKNALLSLYLVLLSNDNYTFFEIAGVTFLILLTTVVYPLTIMWLYFERYVRNQESAAPADENSLIRFYDEYKSVHKQI